MKSFLLAVLILVCCCTQLLAQQFTGYVKRVDSILIPVYMAKVEVYSEGQVVSSQKTYFNGSYSFPTKKNLAYTIKISYTGYKDTAFTITTDKNGKPSHQGFTVKLKKDGMRLLGVLRGADDNFPIAGATIDVKNIMTRKEQRQTTDVDGAYNFKLEYETNYRIYVDKRSPGIENKYKDTIIYVTTIGFNLPLDYKLDIYVERLANAVTDDISSARQPFEKTSAENVPVQADNNIEPTPVVAEKPKQDTVPKMEAEPQKASPAASMVAPAVEAPSKKKKKHKEELEVVVIGDTPIPHNKQIPDTTSVVKTGNENTSKVNADTAIVLSPVAAAQNAARDSIVVLRAEADLKQQESAAKKIYNDSVSKARILARKKIIADSMNNVRLEKEIAAKGAVAKKVHQDSISKARIHEQKLAREEVVKKAKQDSIDRAALILIHHKQIKDSLAQVKLEKEKLAKELAAKKVYDDSIIRMHILARKKEAADSISKVKLEKKAARTLALEKKAEEDSVSKVKIREQKLAVTLKKTKQDSIDMAYTLAVRHKQLRDSLAKVNEENARIVKDAVSGAIYPGAKADLDSVIKIREEARKKLVRDSMAHVTAEKSLAARKVVMDSMAELAYKERKRVVESILRLREQQKNVEKELKAELARRDSAAKTKTGLVAGNTAKPAEDSLYHQRLAEKYKVIQDSMSRANARIEIIAQQIDAKKMLDDSLQKLRAEEKNQADNNEDPHTPKVYPTAKATETPFSDLPAVFFSKNSDTLDESQQINLDGIIKMLSGDNKSQLYLFAIASADENSPKELAIKRNETLTRYLKNAGVTTNRIKTAHPGNKVSRNGCMDINCPEDMLKQNRCVVFQITKE